MNAVDYCTQTLTRCRWSKSAVLSGCLQPLFRDFPPGDFGDAGNVSCADYRSAPKNIPTVRRLPFSMCLHFGHVLLVLRGSTGITGTPASFALYSMNPRNSANDHFDILSR